MNTPSCNITLYVLVFRWSSLSVSWNWTAMFCHWSICTSYRSKCQLCKSNNSRPYIFISTYHTFSIIYCIGFHLHESGVLECVDITCYHSEDYNWADILSSRHDGKWVWHCLAIFAAVTHDERWLYTQTQKTTKELWPTTCCVNNCVKCHCVSSSKSKEAAFQKQNARTESMVKSTSVHHSSPYQ